MSRPPPAPTHEDQAGRPGLLEPMVGAAGPFHGILICIRTTAKADWPLIGCVACRRRPYLRPEFVSKDAKDMHGLVACCCSRGRTLEGMRVPCGRPIAFGDLFNVAITHNLSNVSSQSRKSSRSRVLSGATHTICLRLGEGGWSGSVVEGVSRGVPGCPFRPVDLLDYTRMRMNTSLDMIWRSI